MLPQTLQAVISVEVSSIFHKIGKVLDKRALESKYTLNHSKDGIC